MFGRGKSPDKYRSALKETGYRVNRLSPNGRAERQREKRRPSASSGFVPGKAMRNKRARKEKTPAPAFIPSGWDWGRTRLWIVGVFFLVLGCGLWGRAYHLQINMGEKYGSMAKRQQTTKEVVQGVRGNILDRNGNSLARSVECSSVWANPSQIQDKDAAALQLAKTLGVPASKLRASFRDKKSFVWLKRKVDDRTAEAVKALGIDGVYMDAEYERIYPYEHLAGQLIGFVNIDDKGIEGLEKSLETHLAGRSVTQILERDAAGRRLMPLGAGAIGDLRGKDVRLTIDTRVQFIAEEALAEKVQEFGARWGGCLVVDVPTGDVLAWAQYPFFNPNRVSATPPADRRNRLATDMLEHGSTLKSFLIAAALEEKVVSPTTEIYCEKGRWKFKRVTLHDTHAYDKLPIEKILHVSSNIGAAKVGLMLGAKKYYDYLTRLGFGEPTNLPLPSEAKGILRNYSRWADIDLATASFGQSFSATLVQVAQAYMAIAGSGEKRPLRLVMDDSVYCRIGDPAPAAPTGERVASGGVFSSEAHASVNSPAQRGGDRVFSPETLRQVRSMLREVVEEDGGTGRRARIQGIEVGGKTGTAQKADASGKYGKGRVGSFVGMFPIENPRFLVCVLLDEPQKVQYGGVVAAPVFRQVAEETLAYHGLLPDITEVKAIDEKRELSKKKDKKKGARQADEKAESPAAKPALAAEREAPVVSKAALEQEKPLKPAPKPEPRIYGPDDVPGVVGLGLRNAVEVFAERGIMPAIKGKGGIVTRQAPEAGKPWPEGGKDNCVLWLEEGV